MRRENCNCEGERRVLQMLLSARELAARYGVSKLTVEAWIDSGRLPKADRIIGAKRFWTEPLLAEWELKETRRGLERSRRQRERAEYMRTFRGKGDRNDE